MIDIHSHLLPNVDDGSSSLEFTLQQLKNAKKEGIRGVLLTPHFIKGHNNIDHDVLLTLFKLLKAETKDLGVNLYLGNELFIDYELDRLINDKVVYTLNGSKYVLIEFPFDKYSKKYDEYLYNISINNKIIIAHPERYKYVIDNPEFVRRWLDNGYYLQVNQGSLFIKDKRKVIFNFIEKGYVHMIASDAHNTMRPLTLKDAYELISHKFNEETAKLLFDVNPKMVLLDQDIVIPKKVKKHLF